MKAQRLSALPPLKVSGFLIPQSFLWIYNNGYFIRFSRAVLSSRFEMFGTGLEIEYLIGSRESRGKSRFLVLFLSS